MKMKRLAVGGFSGAIGGALAEAWLAAQFLGALQSIYPPGVPAPTFNANVAASAGLEGLVAGLIAGLGAGIIGRWGYIAVAIAAVLGIQSGIFWLLGGAAGGLVALIALEILRVVDKPPAQ